MIYSTYNKFTISLIFYSISNKIMTDKMTSEKEIDTVSNKVMKKQDGNSGAAVASSNNWVPTTSKIPQPKIDATDRRQIEAQNEDKSHTTKETLDDIKRIHHKEKKKNENNDAEQSLSGRFSEGLVSKTCICHENSLIYISKKHQFNLRYIFIYIYFSPWTAQKMRIRLLGIQT